MSRTVEMTREETRAVLNTIVVVHPDEVLPTDKILEELWPFSLRGLPDAPGDIKLQATVVQRMVAKEAAGSVGSDGTTPTVTPTVTPTAAPTVEPVLDLSALQRPPLQGLAGKKRQAPGPKKSADDLVLVVAGWGRVPRHATKRVLAAAFKDLKVPIELYRQPSDGQRFRCTDHQRPAMETAKQAAVMADKLYQADVEGFIEEFGFDREKAPFLAAELEKLNPAKKRRSSKPAASSSLSPAPAPVPSSKPPVEDLDSDDDFSVVGGDDDELGGEEGDDDEGEDGESD